MKNLPSKRLTLLVSLVLVELLILVVFTLTYTKILWVSWNSSNALYGIIVTAVLLILTIILFKNSYNYLKNATENTELVQAKLISKKTYSFRRRKVVIWKYEYFIDGQPVHKTYWHLNETRKIEENTYFDLFVDKENKNKSYFFLEVN
ncbi:hypothetical protein JNUCC83_05505 [Vagococcus sp. JNUCC 83]